MQLLRQFPSLLFGVDLNMKQRVFGWCWTHWQPAEPINVGLGLPWTMMDGKVVLLQRCRPAVKEPSLSQATGVHSGQCIPRMA